jgi:Alkylmercury lyase
MTSNPTAAKGGSSFDNQLRLAVYRHFIEQGRGPTIREMAKLVSKSLPQVKAAIRRLAESHALVLQENGEVWRAAPFSAVPTAFPVQAEEQSWYGNCVWDALGIPAMLHKDARIQTSCGCCNHEMRLRVRNGQLLDHKGIIHFAVPARHWYKDIVFT